MDRFETSPVGSLRWWVTCRGLKVFLRAGRVWCWAPGNKTAQVTDIDNGNWMEHTDTYQAPWERIVLSDAQARNFEVSAQACYCYQGVDRCDFCTGRRTPDGISWPA